MSFVKGTKEKRKGCGMKKLILIAVVFLIMVLGFYFSKVYLGRGNYVLRINDFTMTNEEFEDYFKETNISGEDSFEARETVLDALISKKLILQEAEREGLHRDKEFLKTLQMYYEQLLFKLIIDKKSKGIGSKVQVSDKEVRQLYNQMLEKGLINKPLEEVYNQVKWQIFREKQTQALSDWLEELKKKAKIEVDREAILNK